MDPHVWVLADYRWPIQPYRDKVGAELTETNKKIEGTISRQKGRE